MIEKIGVICQDANSFGFLAGLRDRLGCKAMLIEAPSPVGRTRSMNRRQCGLAWAYSRSRGVDLVVRLTDADRAPWREVRSREVDRFPDEARALLVCGVATDNTEDWLALDPAYLAEALGVQESDVPSDESRTGTIKRLLVAVRAGRKARELSAALVRDASGAAFKRWLRDPALRHFYDEARAAASRHECETTNEK